MWISPLCRAVRNANSELIMSTTITEPHYCLALEIQWSFSALHHHNKNTFITIGGQDPKQRPFMGESQAIISRPVISHWSTVIFVWIHRHADGLCGQQPLAPRESSYWVIGKAFGTWTWSHAKRYQIHKPANKVRMIHAWNKNNVELNIRMDVDVTVKHVDQLYHVLQHEDPNLWMLFKYPQ